jgi:hypothetical protein
MRTTSADGAKLRSDPSATYDNHMDEAVRNREVLRRQAPKLARVKWFYEKWSVTVSASLKF